VTLGIAPKRTRPRWLGLTAVVAVLFLISTAIALAGTVGTAQGFEDDDANLIDGPTAGIDWNTLQDVSWLPANSTTPTRQADKTASGFAFKGIEDWQATTSDSGFAGGTKQDDNCATVISAKAPNKDDLKRVYLTSKTGADGHTYLNMGWVRIPQNTTSPSAHIGFEFNKGNTPCSTTSPLVQRTAGDMLVVYDFEGGGNPVLTLRRWVTSGACEVGSKTAPCWGAATNLTAGGFAEGAVNESATALDQLAPPALGSSTSVDATLGISEFGEAGVDLTGAGVFTPGACESFGRAYAVSRSSGSSGTAQMKDLAGPGNFSLSNCTVTLTTTPSDTEVTPGESVTDTAVVTGTNTAGTPPTPTGDVSFHLCGPTAVDATALCTTGGTDVGSVALATSAPPAGEASATSAAVNTALSPLLPGRYCFRADWLGDTTYVGAISHTGTGNSECFIVAQIQTTTVTTPSNGSGVGLTSPVAFGTTIYDRAVVTGTAAGGAPAGNVAFEVCDPTEITGAAGAEVCAAGDGDSAGTNALVAIDGSSSAALSDGVLANQAGLWCFNAVYTPTGNIYTTSGDARHNECVLVSKANTDTTTTPSSDVEGTPLDGSVPVGTEVFDHAVVDGVANGGAPGGTIDFFICDPAAVLAAGGTCATGGIAAGDDVALVAIGGSAPPASEASSSGVTVDEVGTWCFRAVYTPGTGSNYNGSSDSSTGECFTVVDSTSITSAQTWRPNDSATLTSLGGSALNGSLSFTLFSGDNCGLTSGSQLRAPESFTLVAAASPVMRATTNTTVHVTTSTTVSWKVVFASTDANVAGFTHCETTALTIDNKNP
jgi:hypothetical protein